MKATIVYKNGEASDDESIETIIKADTEVFRDAIEGAYTFEFLSIKIEEEK